jgi:heme A synthase
MNSAFALMGIAVVISFWGSLRHKYYEDILPIIFGLSFVMVAIFQHEPGITGLAYNHTTALLHSVFATMMGTVISVYAIIKAMKANSTTDRILAVLALVSASGLSFLMYAVPAYTGLLQRMMFLSVLAWIGYLVVSMQSAKSVPSDS